MGQKVATVIFWMLIGLVTAWGSYGFFEPRKWSGAPETAFASISLGAIAVFAVAQSIRTIRKATVDKSHPFANIFFWLGAAYFSLVGVAWLVSYWRG